MINVYYRTKIWFATIFLIALFFIVNLGYTKDPGGLRTPKDEADLHQEVKKKKLTSTKDSDKIELNKHFNEPSDLLKDFTINELIGLYTSAPYLPASAPAGARGLKLTDLSLGITNKQPVKVLLLSTLTTVDPTIQNEANLENTPCSLLLNRLNSILFPGGAKSLTIKIYTYINRTAREALKKEFQLYKTNSTETIFSALSKIIDDKITPDLLTAPSPNAEVLSMVADEFAAYDYLNTKEGYADFYKRRAKFKESALARGKALKLYLDSTSKSTDYAEFLAAFPTPSFEFLIGVEKRRLALLTETLEKDKNAFSDASYKNSIDNTKIDALKKPADWENKRFALWVTLYCEDLESPYSDVIYSKLEEIAIDQEKQYIKSLPMEPTKETRASEIFSKITDINGLIVSKTGSDPLTVIKSLNIAGYYESKFTLDLLRLFMLRQIYHKLLTTLYNTTKEGVSSASSTETFINNGILSRYIVIRINDQLKKNFDEVFSRLDRIDMAIGSLAANLKDGLMELKTALDKNQDEIRTSFKIVNRSLMEIKLDLNTINSKLDGISVRLDTMNETMKNIYDKVEANARQTAAIRNSLYPTPFPGLQNTDAYITSWDTPKEFNDAFSGILTGKLKDILKNFEFVDENTKSIKEWAEAGPSWARFKTIIAEYTYNYKLYVKATTGLGDGGIEIRTLRFGLDKITNEAYVFIDLGLWSKFSGHFKASLNSLAGTGQQNFSDALIKFNTKLKIKVTRDLKFEVEPSDFLDTSVELVDIRLSGFVYDLLRDHIKDVINAKIDIDNIKNQMASKLKIYDSLLHNKLNDFINSPNYDKLKIK